MRAHPGPVRMIILFLAACLQVGFAIPGEAVVRMEPARLEIGAGQVETLQILLVDAQNIYGIDLEATFNPAVVEVVDSDASQGGVQMMAGDFPKADFTVRNRADNAAGTIRYVVTQINPTPPASGTGIVLAIQFRGKVQGRSTKLTFSSAVIADRRGMKQPVSTQESELVVVSPKPSSPTQTPVNTQIPAVSNPQANFNIPADRLQPGARAGGILTQVPLGESAGAVLRLVPPVLELTVGNQGTVDVLVENAHNLYGIEFHLTYDPGIAEVIDAGQGKQGIQILPASWWNEGFIAVNLADNRSGRIDFAATELRPALPVNGTQLAATITFAGRQTGASILRIESAILSSPAAEALAYTQQDGEIRVGASDQTPDENFNTRANASPAGGLILSGAAIIVLLVMVGIIVHAIEKSRRNDQ